MALLGGFLRLGRSTQELFAASTASYFPAVHLFSFQDSKVIPTPGQLGDLWVALQALAARFHHAGVINDRRASLY